MSDFERLNKEVHSGNSGVFLPLLIIISSPSGGGKSTICKMLYNDLKSPLFNKMKFSISATTRKIRKNEEDGLHYHFLSSEDFKKKIENDEFLEHANVFGNYYGTLFAEISKTSHTVLDIDYQGQEQIKDKWRAYKETEEGAKDKTRFISIFLVPPSMETLRERLFKRADISENDIKLRSSFVEKEVVSAKNYDYLVLNDDLSTAFNTISNILQTEMLKSISTNADYTNCNSVIESIKEFRL